MTEPAGCQQVVRGNNLDIHTVYGRMGKLAQQFDQERVRILVSLLVGMLLVVCQ